MWVPLTPIFKMTNVIEPREINSSFQQYLTLNWTYSGSTLSDKTEEIISTNSVCIHAL